MLSEVECLESQYLRSAETCNWFNISYWLKNNLAFFRLYILAIPIQSTAYLNYNLFRKGKIKLEGVAKKNNKAHTYNLTFFGNGINLKDLIGEDKLDAL